MDNELLTDSTIVDAAHVDNVSTHDATDVGIADELLIEEISIDGMCGVY